MRRTRTTILATVGGVLAAATLTAGLSAPAPAEVASAIGDAPAEQPWGPAPANIGSYKNGEILNSKQVEANILEVPLPATAWQVRYKSIDVHGDPNVYITTVLVPKTEWTGSGPRPLVSYQFAEDGVAYKCAPSWQLSGGGTAALGGGEPVGLLLLALARGWAVTAPDYEGPASEFAGADGSAHGVLDGIRATRNFSAAGVSADAPVGLWGYSGGAMASAWAAAAQPSYAPDVKLAGVALGGTPASLAATAKAFNAIPGVSSAINVAFAGIDRSYPERNISQYLNETGRAQMRAAGNDCVYSGITRNPFASLANSGVTDAELDTMVKGISPLDFPGTPKAPILMYNSIIDEFAPIGPARQLAKRYCDAGLRLKKVESFLGEHALYAITGAPVAVSYLADRFAGKAAPTTC